MTTDTFALTPTGFERRKAELGGLLSEQQELVDEMAKPPISTFAREKNMLTSALGICNTCSSALRSWTKILTRSESTQATE